MTKRKGRFITRIGTIITYDEALLSILRDQGFHLRKINRCTGPKQIDEVSSYDIFMEDDE